jgi:hypothetical protein
VYVQELTKHAKNGKDSTASIVKELIQYGYIKRTIRRDKGKFLGYDYDIIESGVESYLPKSDKPKTDSSETETPKTDNPQLLNTNFNQLLTIPSTNNTNQDTDLPTKEVTSLKLKVEESFDKFWNIYDKKVCHKKSLDKWKKLKQTNIDKILSTVEAYVKSKPDKKFRKDPMTYLNNECWNDEIDTPKATHTGKQIHTGSCAKLDNQEAEREKKRKDVDFGSM